MTLVSFECTSKVPIPKIGAANMKKAGSRTARKRWSENNIQHSGIPTQSHLDEPYGLAGDIGCLIYQFEKGYMDDGFAAFVENVYNDIPAKDDPLRIQVIVETLKRPLSLNLW
jgi:hypothetical protein